MLSGDQGPNRQPDHFGMADTCVILTMVRAAQQRVAAYRKKGLATRG
jgi:hypothetical protein